MIAVGLPIASGPISEPKQLLIDLVAESPTFQMRVGAESPEAARRKIFRNRLRVLDHSAQRPYAIVAWGSNFSFQMVSGGSFNYLRPSGSLWLYLTDKYRFPDPETNALDFENYVGEVMQDLAAGAALDRNLAITAISFATPPMDAHPASELLTGDAAPWWEAALLVDWE